MKITTTIERNETAKTKREPPCIYKKSCGNGDAILLKLCGEGSCPEYKPKKRGEPYFGEEEKENNDKR
jgi:hypothetical protein